MGVEILPGFERERVVAALGVGELNLVPDLEGPASAGGTGRFGHVTSVLASGPGPCHGLHEGGLDVEGGQDAVDGSAGFEDEVLGGGGGAEVVEEFFAGEVRGNLHAVGEVLGEGADGDPGAAVFGDGGDGAFADDGDGVAVAVDDDEGAGSGFVGAAEGLGEGGGVLDGGWRGG